MNKEENFSIDIDESMDMPLQEVKQETKKSKVKNTKRIIKEESEEPSINCLRNERIIVKHIPRQTGLVTNPKHILYGGMAEDAIRVFVVPRLTSGRYVNVLTDSEKDFLEETMGLEANALSIYNKVDNFWDDSNENGISRVTLRKQDNYFDLSSPEDYIRYKILLANKNFIAPSLQELQDRPKATYQFVITSENDTNKVAKDNMSYTMKCYKEYGKIEDNIHLLRVIIETIDGRPTSPTAKLEFLQTKINDLIQSDSKLFYKIITDPMLPTKSLIKRSIEAGLISKRGDYLYLKSDGSPLCNFNEEPTFNIASKYLNLPKNQELKMSLEAKLKEYEQ